MFDITKDIHSVTTFKRNPGQFMKQLKKNKRPMILTVKGKVAAVVQDAEAYQHLLDIAARTDIHEAIAQGLSDKARGRTRPARDAFDQIRAQHDIPAYLPCHLRDRRTRKDSVCIDHLAWRQGQI